MTPVELRYADAIRPWLFFLTVRLDGVTSRSGSLPEFLGASLDDIPRIGSPSGRYDEDGFLHWLPHDCTGERTVVTRTFTLEAELADGTKLPTVTATGTIDCAVCAPPPPVVPDAGGGGPPPSSSASPG